MIVFNIVTCSLQSKPTLTQVTLLEAIYQTQLPLESQKALYIYKITLTKTCKQTNFTGVNRLSCVKLVEFPFNFNSTLP